jgi:predicted RNA-binding protein with PUA-like domain
VGFLFEKYGIVIEFGILSYEMAKSLKKLQKNYWLVKSEPTCYSIDDFARDKKTRWTGVRNYQARNFMRDGMKIGDEVLFYHSSTEIPAIVGLGKITALATPDVTAFDKKDEHYDPKSTNEKPIWYAPEISFVKKFKNPITLGHLKLENSLKGMVLLQKGSRLSVQPVSEDQFTIIVDSQ